MPKVHPGHDTRHVKLARNTCFGCGNDNPEGMRLKFRLDEERARFVGRFRLARRYQGPPGHAHGGIIATILDEAMGKVNKLRHVIALTKNMEVHYRKPVPLNRMLTVTAREDHVNGREHTNSADITNEDGEILASGTATFVLI